MGNYNKNNNKKQKILNEDRKRSTENVQYPLYLTFIVF